MRKIGLLFYLVLTNLITGKTQQLPSWSSFYENGFIWNPALTAQWSSWEASVTHRQEWTGFQFAPQYTTAAFQMPLSDAFFQTNASVGGFLQRDQIGPYSIHGIAGTYSYKIIPQLFGNKEDMLALGVLAETKYFKVDADRIIQFQDVGTDIHSSSYQPNISLGFFYRSNGYLNKQTDHFFFGAAVHRLIPFSFGDVRIGSFTNDFYAAAHGGFQIFASPNFYFEPNVMMVYGYQKAMDIMLSIRAEAFEKIWFGGGASTTGEVFGQVGVVMDRSSIMGGLVGDGALRIGAKADYRLGSLNNFSGMGYELYVAYQHEIK